jgi:hypothetical protein
MTRIQITIIAGALSLAVQAQANLIQNGSFETGTFSGNRENGSVTQLFDGSAEIIGWTVLGGGGGSSGDIAWENDSNPWGFKASEGTKFLDLTGYINDSTQPHGGITLQQTVNTTIGTRYVLTFDVGSSRAYSSGIDPVVQVDVNGTPSPYVFTGNNHSLSDAPGANNHWQQATFEFVANGSTAEISFTAITPGTDNVIDLDNVSLTAVPEPTTMIAGALLLLPFGASTIRIVRRNRMA